MRQGYIIEEYLEPHRIRDPPMTSISVLLPTANRPAMLRNALRSVAAQTSLSRVAEVVVIENLGNRESEAVCQEFTQLPIRYFFRDPPLPPGIESARDALTKIRCNHMAILCDDDWWMERHLESAIDAIESHPNAVAFYCPCIWTTGEVGYLTNVFGSFIPWFAASEPLVNHRWHLDLADLLVASQIDTAFHFSSMVVQRDVFTKSIECFANGNSYDTDRLISVELGRHGKVICDDRPSVYIRFHKDREAVRVYNNDQGRKWWNQSTKSLLALARSEGIDLEKEFAARLKAKSVTLNVLRPYFTNGQFELLRQKGILKTAIKEGKTVSLMRRTYHALTPPILQKKLKQFRDVPS
jgi:glycosyltransferase involved in cell wall biosynthesis